MIIEKNAGHTQALVDFVAERTYSDLPIEVVECAKRMILDTLGCAVGGHALAAQQMVLDVARELGGKPQATVVVSGERVSAPVAAFANADMANALDADETLRIATHVGSVVALSGLAAGERARVTGKELITAVALGYDIAVRIGFSLIGSRVVDGEIVTSHVHGLGCAAIGAAMTAGKLFKLGRESMADAMGIAGVFCPSPVAAKLGNETRLTTLKVNPKMVLAHSGVLAAMLAERGYTGDRTILDGDRGFWRFQGALGSRWGLLTEELGQKWWILESAVKPYPACRFIHHSLDLLYKIMDEQKLAFDDVQAVTVGMAPSKKRLLAIAANPDLERDHSDPATVINLQFNTPYLLAVAALGIPPGPAWYKADLLADSQIRNFMKRVNIKAHPRSVGEEIRAIRDEPTGRGKTFPTSLSIVAKGETFDAETDYAKGDPYFLETKVSNEKLKEKFRTFCGGVLPPGKIEQAIQTVFGLEQLDDVNKLAALMTR